MKKLIFLLLGFSIPVIAGGSAFAATYTITDLGTLGGATSYAYGINNNGQVAGYSKISGNSDDHAFIYDGGKMTDLGSLGGTTSYAYGINNSGQVVGESKTGSGTWSAFLYDGAMKDLGMPGYTSTAHGINNSGQVAGSSGFPYIPATHAFLYDGGTMKDLGSLGGVYSDSIDSYAAGVNDKGQVVGESKTTIGTWSAFLYENGTMKDLGSLGGENSAARGINNKGQVVGSSDIVAFSPFSHAFLYSDGKMTDLGTLVGVGYSEGTGINNNGQVVGYSWKNTGALPSAYRAFIYENGKMTDLNSLVSGRSGWVLNEAFGINDKGQIIGVGNIGLGQEHAFLLTPVPIPPSLPLFVSGIGGMWYFRRKARA